MKFTAFDDIPVVDRGQKVTRNHASALVDELVEGVLAVCARLAPDDGTGVVGDGDPVASHVLAIGLHITLLEVGRKAGHVLIVGQDGLGLSVVAIDVHDTDQCQDDGDLGKIKKIKIKLVATCYLGIC